MSQLETNTTDLQAILDAVNALPDAGGGGSVETCTIRLVCTRSRIYGYTYLAYRNGALVPVIWNGGVSSGITLDVSLTDVICNGYIYVHTMISNDFLATTVTGDATVETLAVNTLANMSLMVYAPSASGSESTVTIIDND